MRFLAMLESWPRRRQIALAAALPVLMLLPFLGKAYHIDDPLFVWTAQQIDKSPGDFFGFNVNWYTRDQPMYAVMQNPPLISYYLAPFGKVFGWNEYVMHGAMLLPTILFSVGALLLASRLGPYPIFTWLVILFSPGVFLSACQVMSDVPMMACWVWAMYLWLRGIDKGSNAYCISAAVLIAAGTLTKYFAGSLVPLLAVYTVMQGRTHRQRLYFLAIPAAALVVFEFYTYRLYGLGLFADAGRFAAQVRADQHVSTVLKSLTTLVFTGGCMIFTLVLAAPLWPRLVRFGGGAMILVFSVLAAFAFTTTLFRPVQTVNIDVLFISGSFNSGQIIPAIPQYIQWGIFLVAGLNICALSAFELYQRRDSESLLLAMWIFGSLFFVAAINHFVNGRVVITVAPAAAILVARRLKAVRNADSALAMPYVARALCAAAALSLLLAYADERLANTARQAAHDLLAKTHGGKVWFTGHSGFQYYMQLGGAKPIDEVHDIALAGDWYCLPTNNWSHIAIGSRLIGAHENLFYNTVPFLTASHYQAYAGFYSDNTGPLPYVFARIPSERYALVKVIAPPTT